MHLVFDGGYSQAHKQGVWAVVKVDGASEELIEIGYCKDVRSSSDIEWVAAERAAFHAEELGIELIQGDFASCINGMSKTHEHLDWEWIPSRSNVADKYAKFYPELM